MAKGFKHGAGGGGLNFKVICNPQPSTAKENTIWIDTDTITSWIFSATEPSSAEPGMVWISIAKSSRTEFNALKKNGIQVYPISAKQYIEGVWVDKLAKSYQGGAWVDWWDGEIFSNGVAYFPLDRLVGFFPDRGSGSATIYEDRIYFNSDDQEEAYLSTPLMDVSAYKAIKTTLSNFALSNTTQGFEVYVTTGTTRNSGTVASAMYTSSGTYTLPIPTTSNQCRIVFGSHTHAPGDYARVDLTKLKFELR